MVVFYVEDIAEGQEVAIDGNIYLTRPDNFNQLRSLVAGSCISKLRGFALTMRNGRGVEFYDK